MYAEYWGLNKMPFENISDPYFFYYSSKHKEALARMSYAVQQKKLGVLLVGEYGTGKTFLSRVLKKIFLEGKYKFIFITNPRLTALEFIREIDYQLQGEASFLSHPTKMDYLRSIKKSLEDLYNKDTYTVIVVDEAQSIQDDELFEEVRLLLNTQSDEAVLFTLLLLGQPQVEEKVSSIPQFKQRLSIRFRLAPLTKEETVEYIEHRLKAAGTSRRIFTNAAYAEIYNLSQGMPRAVNNICDLSLLGAFIKKAEIIDKDTVVHVGEDLGELNKRNQNSKDTEANA